MACDNVLSEFTLDKFNPNHDRPRDFVESQWPFIHPKPYAVYRVVLALGFIAWVIADFWFETVMYYWSAPWTWFLFGTNWTFVMTAIAFVCLAVLCVRSSFVNSDSTAKLPTGYQGVWIIHTIAIICMPLASIVFWLAYSYLINPTDAVFSIASKIKHSVAAAILLLDFAVSAIPVRLVHYVYPLLFGIVYILFNLMYFVIKALASSSDAMDKRVIYPSINWRDPYVAVTVILSLFLIGIVVECVVYVVYVFRTLIYEMSVGPRNGGDEEKERILPEEADSATDYGSK